MNNSQQAQDSDTKKLYEELNSVNLALTKLKDCEKVLYEIKNRLEYFVSYFNDTDPKKRKPSKSSNLNVLPLHAALENLLINNILPVVKPSKTRVDENLYRKYLQNEKLVASIKTFKEEIAAVLKDRSCFQDFRGFSEAFKGSGKGLIELPYDLLRGILEFFALKEKFLMVRFDNSTEFNDLPESFYVCIIRIDLMTITLSFRKAPQPTVHASPSMMEIEGTTTDISKPIVNKVVLYNIVYSNIFDCGSGKIDFRVKTVPFSIEWKFTEPNDPNIKKLIEILRDNQEKISLPCLYPSLAIYQRYSHFITEKIEKIYKTGYLSQGDVDVERKLLEDILGKILKTFPDELSESMEARCYICTKRFALDSKMQKMLPPFSHKIDQKKEKIGSNHIGCKKLYENPESDGPQVIVKIECSDTDTDYFMPGE